jgi:TetR/AcrR family transcriptional regulator, regulator of biofilm formation and stress response
MNRSNPQREAAPVTDGRRARGQRRRSEIIRATLRVIERDGAAGVTHRAVAREAATTTSLTTYHFTTLDDLLVAALSAIADEYVQQLQQITESADPLTGLAELIATSGSSGRTRALAERELSTLAARRPALRPVARRWRDAVAEIARLHTADPTAVEALVAAADGLCTAILIQDRQPDPASIRRVLAQALSITSKSSL